MPKIPAMAEATVRMIFTIRPHLPLGRKLLVVDVAIVVSFWFLFM